MSKPIYLDYNATTPIHPQVAAAMRPYLDEFFGNPSSGHAYGLATRQKVEEARSMLAHLLGANPDEIIFTSGGTEANNMAIKGAAMALVSKGRHLITSAIEHPAVIQVFEWLQTQGFELTILPVDKYGQVNPDDLAAAIRPDTTLVSIMHANNEVGTLQPISTLAAIARQRGVVFHTDAAQSVGKVPCLVNELNVDLLSVAGHKFYGPKGIGALYVRRGTKLQRFMHGADHEHNRRAGTENIMEIAGLGAAARLASQNLKQNAQHMLQMRDLLEQQLKQAGLDFIVNGHPQQRLPNTLSVSFYNTPANTILAQLPGVAASAGAACHSDLIELSAVLTAMQVPADYALGTIRFSTGYLTTQDDIKSAASQVIQVVTPLQKPKTATVTGSIKLTSYTGGLGCACKLEPGLLEQVTKDLPMLPNPNILVGAENSDDAAVYQLNDNTALVSTVDFLTPIVDDPYQYGAIAAANALSDIYAMGATPLFALNVVAFPSNRLPLSVLKQIMQGAADKAKEAGISIVGGHTIDDPEPKFGLAVTGTVHPQKVWKNSTAKPGDALILTKPLGSGVLSTALKNGILPPQQQTMLYQTLAQLNGYAAKVLAGFTVHACTDVTGFGLLGHALELAMGSGCSLSLNSQQVPLMDGIIDFIRANLVPGGSKANMRYVQKHVNWLNGVDPALKTAMCDAQTSGGLLVALPQNQASQAMQALTKAKVTAWIIGEVTAKQAAFINVK